MGWMCVDVMSRSTVWNIRLNSTKRRRPISLYRRGAHTFRREGINMNSSSVSAAAQQMNVAWDRNIGASSYAECVCWRAFETWCWLHTLVQLNVSTTWTCIAWSSRTNSLCRELEPSSGQWKKRRSLVNRRRVDVCVSNFTFCFDFSLLLLVDTLQVGGKSRWKFLDLDEIRGTFSYCVSATISLMHFSSDSRSTFNARVKQTRRKFQLEIFTPPHFSRCSNMNVVTVE